MYTMPVSGELMHGLMCPRIDHPDRDEIVDTRRQLSEVYQHDVVLIESDPDYWIFAATDDAHPPGTETVDYEPLKYIVYPPVLKNQYYHAEMEARARWNTRLRTEWASQIPS